MYWLFIASELLNCEPWVLAEQPEFWTNKAFWFHDIRNRTATARQKIDAHRNGEDVEDDEDDEE